MWIFIASAVLSLIHTRIVHHSGNWRIAWNCIRCRQSGKGHTDFLCAKSLLHSFYTVVFFFYVRLFIHFSIHSLSYSFSSSRFSLPLVFVILYASLSFCHLSKAFLSRCVVYPQASAMGSQRNYSKHFYSLFFFTHSLSRSRFVRFFLSQYNLCLKYVRNQQRHQQSIANSFQLGIIKFIGITLLSFLPSHKTHTERDREKNST